MFWCIFDLANNRVQFQSCFDYAEGKGVEVIIPKDDNDFLINDVLYIGSNTTITFLGSYIKLNHYTTVGTVLFNKPDSENITIHNPLIDGSDIIAGGTGEKWHFLYEDKTCSRLWWGY